MFVVEVAENVKHVMQLPPDTGKTSYSPTAEWQSLSHERRNRNEDDVLKEADFHFQREAISYGKVISFALIQYF